jgi:uncharacterized protein YqfA (UPF0365 family)
VNLELLVILMLAIGVPRESIAAAIGYLYYVRVWFRAHVVGATVPFTRLFGITLKRLSAHRLIYAYARAREEGIALSLDDLEIEYRAGAIPGSSCSNSWKPAVRAAP